MSNTDTQKKSEAAALLSTQPSSTSCTNCPTCKWGRPTRPRPYWTHCKCSGHTEPKCWEKYPELNPRNKKKCNPKPAFIATEGDEDPTVCLIAKYDKILVPSFNELPEDPPVCLMTKYENSDEHKNSGNWYIDSACSSHMSHDKSLFSFYYQGHHSPVEMGNSARSTVAGTGTFDLEIYVNGKQVKCRLKNVLHVPGLGYQLLSAPSFDKFGLRTSFESQKCRIE